jgi:SAM-dependent methyltransferase
MSGASGSLGIIFMKRIETRDTRTVKEIMYSLWDKIGIPETTKERNHTVAMDGQFFHKIIFLMQEYFSFENKDVIDLGCGWGTLSKLLLHEGCKSLTSVDIVPEHAAGTLLQAPQASVYDGDACNLDLIPDESIDIAISRSLIEHIDTEGKRGLATKLDGKQAHVNEMARILRVGGRGMIETGNYNFPFDGEVDKWLFHWLPADVQNEWLKLIGESADTYTFLRWPILKKMIEYAGLKIIEVRSLDSERWIENIRKLIPEMPNGVIDMIKNLISIDPNYMSSWFIFFEKV